MPDDIAVVGFHNWNVIAAATRPAITTVDMNLHELSHQAGLRLLDMMDGPRPTGVERLPCSLVGPAAPGLKAVECQARLW